MKIFVRSCGLCEGEIWEKCIHALELAAAHPFMQRLTPESEVTNCRCKTDDALRRKGKSHNGKICWIRNITQDSNTPPTNHPQHIPGTEFCHLMFPFPYKRGFASECLHVCMRVEQQWHPSCVWNLKVGYSQNIEPTLPPDFDWWQKARNPKGDEGEETNRH